MSSESSQHAKSTSETSKSKSKSTTPIDDSDKSHTSHSAENVDIIHPRRPSAIPESELPEYVTYSCIRSKPSGHCIHFQLSLDDRDLYHAKVKSTSQIEPIPVSAGKEVHYSKKNDFYMLTNKSHEVFSLRAKSPNGEEMFVFSEYQIISIDDPKNISVVYKKSETDQRKVKFINKKPTKQSDGNWVLDFSERYTVPSKKNAILIDEETGKEMIVVRKVENFEIELDAYEPIPPIYVFAVALSFWLSPI